MKLFKRILGLIPILVLNCCGKPEIPKIPVQSISMSVSQLEMTVDELKTLVVSFTPEDATDKSLTWTSDNESIVTVSSAGVVKAVSAGNATVTAQTVNQEKTSCTIIVRKGINAITKSVTNISCQGAKIEGQAKLPAIVPSDLTFGILYSTTSGVLMDTAIQILARSFDSEYNFSVKTDVLEMETTYYYRSYIMHKNEVVYGEVKSFKTLPLSSMLQTLDATDINPKDATFNAKLDLTDCFYENCEYGFEVTPASGQPYNAKSQNHSDNKFSYKDENLAEDTKYKVKAYVKLDGKTYKGEPIEFTTSSIQASVTAEPQDVSYYAAKVTGKLSVASEGSFTKSVKVYYSKTANTLANLKSSGSVKTPTLASDGSYTASLTELTLGTTYYFVAIAKVDDKEFASEVKSFTTTAVEEISISKSDMELIVGDSDVLSATVSPIGAEMAWSSSTSAVASVDASGKVTALTIGTTVISASAGSKTASCSVTVNGKENNLSLTPSWNTIDGLTYGTNGTISINNPSNGALSIVNTPSSAVAKASSISGGRINITPIASGETSITIKSAKTSTFKEVTQTLAIKVSKADPIFLISHPSLSLLSDQQETITITSNSDCTFTASSSNPSVATVSVSGKTVAVNAKSPGQAVITINCPATSKYNARAALICNVKILSTIDLSANGTANSYIVTGEGGYKIKTVKGNSSTSAGAASSAEVLWESFGTNVTPSVGDLVFSVSYSDGYIRFIASDKKGNAVIAAKDARGNIIWSWHIWLTDMPQDQVYNNNAGTLMDRNLGATSATPGDVHAFGLLYQWGRKDPFLGSSSISSAANVKSTITWPPTVSSSSSNGTIAYATAHPTTFITCNLINYDWYYTGSAKTDNTRWQTSGMAKGLYDPCPVGYRVPDGGNNGVWAKASGKLFDWETKSNWDLTNKGMDFGKTDKKLGSGVIWYPAAAALIERDGSLYDAGYKGFYWSCTPYSSSAYAFYFTNEGIVAPMYTTSHGYGFSVRCVKE